MGFVGGQARQFDPPGQAAGVKSGDQLAGNGDRYR
jgi:hypothetical protein